METEKLYFFTATILEWKPLLKEDVFKDIIMDSLEFLVTKKRNLLKAFVIMPNHIHLMWNILTPNNPSDVQRDFLKYTLQQIITQLKKRNDTFWFEQLLVKAGDRYYQVWEWRPLAIELYTPDVKFQKLKYIHHNPIQERWQLCKLPEEYKYSSAGFYYMTKTDWSFLTHYLEYGM